MNQHPITVPFDEMFLPQDLQRAQYLKEKVRLFINEQTHAFHAGDFVAAGHYATLINDNIRNLTELSNARANFERGYRAGVAETRRSVPDLTAALQGSTIVIYHGGLPHEAR